MPFNMWLMFMGHYSDSRFCEVAPMFSFMFVQKAHLELEGHTAVQPSEFFLGDNGSTLIIILRNEDIVEHICEVMGFTDYKVNGKRPATDTHGFIDFSITGPKFAHA